MDNEHTRVSNFSSQLLLNSYSMHLTEHRMTFISESLIGIYFQVSLFSLLFFFFLSGAQLEIDGLVAKIKGFLCVYVCVCGEREREGEREGEKEREKLVIQNTVQNLLCSGCWREMGWALLITVSQCSVFEENG